MPKRKLINGRVTPALPKTFGQLNYDSCDAFMSIFGLYRDERSAKKVLGEVKARKKPKKVRKSIKPTKPKR